MNEKETKKISKFLSLVLRHKPEKIGITLDAQGWTSIEGIIEASNLKLDLEKIVEVVKLNNKQRFSISEDGERIRANQGHSVDVDLELNACAPPEKLFHGTAIRFIDSILKTGLASKNRNHVHLSADVETAAAVGRRHGKLVMLEINAALMNDEGHAFFLSENGVWLCKHVPPSFINQIESS